MHGTTHLNFPCHDDILPPGASADAPPFLLNSLLHPVVGTRREGERRPNTAATTCASIPFLHVGGTTKPAAAATGE